MRPATRVFEVEQHYQPEALAKRLSVHRCTVLRACWRGRKTHGREGIWPWRKLGRALLIPASAATRWIEGAN